MRPLYSKKTLFNWVQYIKQMVMTDGTNNTKKPRAVNGLYKDKESRYNPRLSLRGGILHRKGY